MPLADQPPPTVTLRPMRQHDIDAGLRLCRASGWNQVRRDWEWFLTLAPGGMWVAEHNSRVAGTVAAVRYGHRFGWIGMVLVDPAIRGRGIGTRLLDHALALLSDLPTTRLDATQAGYPLYLARQFTDERRIDRMQVLASESPVPIRAGVRPMRDSDLDDVSAFDAHVFGADRTPMLRWLWEGATAHAWVAADGSGLAGYTFGRHGHDFDHLGPIVAADADTAQGLAAACLGTQPGRKFVVDAASGDPAWVAALEGLGFRHQRHLIRMSRGAGSIPGDPSRQFAILGPEFG